MKVIGLGCEFRHDDAVGLISARKLQDRGIPALEHSGDSATLIEQWAGTDSLILIDAVVSHGAPGSLHRLDVSTTPLDRMLFASSTHALGLADAVELSRSLGTLPTHVYVFGVEVRNLAPGVGLSPEVEAALPRLIEEVLTLMSRA